MHLCAELGPSGLKSMFRVQEGGLFGGDGAGGAGARGEVSGVGSYSLCKGAMQGDGDRPGVLATVPSAQRWGWVSCVCGGAELVCRCPPWGSRHGARGLWVKLGGKYSVFVNLSCSQMLL